MLVTLAAGVCRRVDQYGFVSFVIGRAFDSAFAHFDIYAQRKLDGLSSVCFLCWFTYNFADDGIYSLVKAVLPLQKQDVS